MGSIDEIYVGCLESATDLNKHEYFDWRHDYVDKQGLICIYKSENMAKGKYFINFCLVDDISQINDQVDHLKTSPGNIYIDLEDGIIRLKTQNSFYSFNRVKEM